jgi:hypothetical protein
MQKSKERFRASRNDKQTPRILTLWTDTKYDVIAFGKREKHLESLPQRIPLLKL